MNSITPIAHPAIIRYSQGELTASEAADQMGGDATVHDVIYQMREAGLPLPPSLQTVNQEAVARALKMFGLAP